MRFGRNPRKWGKPPEDKNTEYWTNKIVIRALNSKIAKCYKTKNLVFIIWMFYNDFCGNQNLFYKVCVSS